MPPHSQGAERRTVHRAGHTGSRWGLRALIVGGLAGAVWLLTGAAAHAADCDPAAGGSSLGTSLIGSVVHGDDHTIPVLDRFLKAAAQPLEPALHRISSIARELTAPLRPAGVAVDTREPALVSEVKEPESPQAAPAPAPAGQPDQSELDRASPGKADTAPVSVPAPGPGPAADGGSAAFLPARFAVSTVACHRLPVVTDVEVRRHDAEAPTVSPD